MNANIEYTDFLNDKEVRAFLSNELGMSGSIENIRLLRLIAQDYQKETGKTEIDSTDKDFVTFLQTHDFGGLFGRF